MKLFNDKILLFMLFTMALNVNAQSELKEEGTVAQMSPDDLLSVSSLSNINTKESDFGGYPLGSDIFYCSSVNVLGPIKRVDKNTGKPLYNLYKGTVAENDLKSSKLVDKLKKIHMGPVCVTPDQKYVFITSDHMSERDNNGNKNLQIYRSEMIDEFDESNLESLPVNGINYSTGHPAISNDGKTLYFASNMPGGFGGVDLYKIELKEDGSFGEYQNLGPDINTSGDEYFPWVGEDEMLFFSSNGHGGFGGLDVFVVYKSGENWKGLTNLGSSLNTSADEFAFILMNNGTTGYFSSNRETGKGDDDIYGFELKSSLKRSFSIFGVVADAASSEAIPNAIVSLVDEEKNILGTTKTDDNGNYTFDVEPNKNYSLSVTYDGYDNTESNISTNGIVSNEPQEENIQLDKHLDLALYGLINDKETKNPIEGASLKIVDNISGAEFGEFETNKKGEISRAIEDKAVGDRVSYSISVSKEGYLSTMQVYNGVVPESGIVNFTDELDFSLVKVEEGVDLGKLINLNPIYFDLGKSNIRKDAALELDKIVKILNENPEMAIELGAHTDARGTAKSNLSLSDRRAKSSAKYIKERISNPERVSGKGYGESQLLNDCSDGKRCSEEDHSLNRRTEFRIVN